MIPETHSTAGRACNGPGDRLGVQRVTTALIAPFYAAPTAGKSDRPAPYLAAGLHSMAQSKA